MSANSQKVSKSESNNSLEVELSSSDNLSTAKSRGRGRPRRAMSRRRAKGGSRMNNPIVLEVKIAPISITINGYVFFVCIF